MTPLLPIAKRKSGKQIQHGALLRRLAVLPLIALLGLAMIFDNPTGSRLMTELQQGLLAFLEDLDPRYIAYTLEHAGLPAYDLQISGEHLQTIHAALEAARKQHRMAAHNQVWVPATFTHDATRLKVSVRIHGALPEHWLQDKKSWRIKCRKGTLFQGKRAFNLIVPFSRKLVAEPTAATLAERLGVMAPRNQFVILRINGVMQGVYYESEQWGKALMALHDRPETDFFCGSDVRLDDAHAGYASMTPELIRSISWQKSHDGKSSDTPMWLGRLQHLLRLLSTASRDELKQTLPFYLDMDKYLAYNAILCVFGDFQAHLAGNMKLYYNNTTGLFEPALYNVGLAQVQFRDGAPRWRHIAPNAQAETILQNPEWRRIRDQYIWKIVTEDKDMLLNEFERQYHQIRSALFSDPLIGKSRREIQSYYDATRQVLMENLKQWKGFLDFQRIFAELQQHPINGGTNIRIKISSNGYAPIAIHALSLTLSAPDPALPAGRIGLFEDRDHDGLPDHPNHPVAWGEGNREGKTIVFEDLDIHLDQRNRFYAFVLDSSSPGGLSLSEKISDFHLESRNEVTARATNNAQEVHWNYADRRSDYSSMSFGTLQEFLDMHKDIPLKTERGRLVLGPGEHAIHHTMMVPVGYGLKIQAGTTLLLDPNVSILAYGNLAIEGTRDRPVHVLPRNEKTAWGVLGVSRAESAEIRHAFIAGGSEATLNGIFFSGQLSLYSVKRVHIRDSTFSRANADDGVNIKNANIHIRQCRFVDNPSDALDCDWVRGRIRHSVFIRNGGDALDLSGSDIHIDNNRIFATGDKGISLGEKSTATIFNNYMEDCDYGIAVKDLSHALLCSNTILQAKAAGVGLYQKKAFFGGGEARIINCMLFDNAADIQQDAQSGVTISHSYYNGNFMNRPLQLPRLPLSHGMRILPDSVMRDFGMQGDPQAIVEAGGPRRGQVPIGILGDLLNPAGASNKATP